eukprot:TRINITY_DN2528_c0_g1_i1.p1 TRINITY_DN2528_c0_g1~~TRINITY_DN2528_c0_g1_i1.p1  ORF type:complete len:216 (+),score=9.44 TRINITY_DN2528_c0_g1_i1:61-708(+)
MDIDMYQHEDGAHTHKGFTEYATANGLLYGIQEQVEELTKPGEAVIVTGHSLGAGPATICAYLLAKAYPERNFITIVFAGCEVGDYQFAEKFTEMKNLAPLLRVSHMNDALPALNLPYYTFFGHELYLRYPLGDAEFYTDHNAMIMCERCCNYWSCFMCSYWAINLDCRNCGAIDFTGLGCHNIDRYRDAIGETGGSLRNRIDSQIQEHALSILD